MLVTDDAETADRCRVLRGHGARNSYYHSAVGGNFRLDALQAAFLSVKLAKFDGYNAARRENGRRYSEALSSAPGIVPADVASCCRGRGSEEGVKGGPSLVLPGAAPGRDHIWNQYTVRVPGEGRRDALRAHLKENGIGSEVYYPVPMHRQECFAGLPADSLEGVPVAERLAGEVLSIPVYPELQRGQQDRVVETVLRFING
jgi:dTDP-4-amino-4,6-dideoxygalactose transaminase